MILESSTLPEPVIPMALPAVLGFLMYDKNPSTDLLVHHGVHVGPWFMLPEPLEFEKSDRFEVFSKDGNTFTILTSQMLPICDEEESIGLFIHDYSPLFTTTNGGPLPGETAVKILLPLLGVGCKPILFSRKKDFSLNARTPFPRTVALSANIGFIREEDAILAKVLADQKYNG